MEAGGGVGGGGDGVSNKKENETTKVSKMIYMFIINPCLHLFMHNGL